MRTTATAIATRTAPRMSQRVRLQPARPCCCSRYVLIPLITRLAPQRFCRPSFPYALLTHAGDGRRRAARCNRATSNAPEGAARLRQRAVERGAALGEYGLAVRDDDELDRKLTETCAEFGPERAHGPFLLGFREPGHRQLDAPVCSDQEVSGDERAMRLEVEERLDPVAAVHDLGPHTAGKLASLLRSPERCVIAIEDGCNAPLVPVNGQEHLDGTRHSLDVAVERRPEKLVLVGRHDRVDDDQRIR